MSYNRLTISQRRFIEHYLSMGKSRSEIARLIGVHRSTVCNEIRRNSVGGIYQGWKAQRLAQQRCGRPSKSKRTGISFHSIPGKSLNDRIADCIQRNTGIKMHRPGRFKEKRVPAKEPYEYETRFEQECYRQWYLTRRKRDHKMERLTRALRRHEDWKRYRKTGWFVIRKGLFNAPYNRVYKHSHRGIVKGHYRMSGWYGGEDFSDLYANRFPFMRYEIQAPVKAPEKILADWLRGQAPSGNSSADAPYFFRPVFKPKGEMPFIFEVFLMKKDHKLCFVPVKISAAFKGILCPVFKTSGLKTSVQRTFAARTS